MFLRADTVVTFQERVKYTWRHGMGKQAVPHFNTLRKFIQGGINHIQGNK